MVVATLWQLLNEVDEVECRVSVSVRPLIAVLAAISVLRIFSSSFVNSERLLKG